MGPVCIVGAGSSGIVASKLLADRGVEHRGFELGSDVGGIWRFRNDSGRSPAYESLRSNTSRHRTAYRCFPMEGPAEYLPNAELLAYFEAFATRFGVRDRFSFRTEVVRVAGREGGGFEVTTRDVATGAEETADFAAVIVAAGHHWDAKRPAFPGTFDGALFHSREYRSPREPVDLDGERVMVVGIGNSACDIVCEVSGAARHTVLSTRRSAHVLPKTLLGRPIDLWVNPLSSRLPVGVQAAILRGLVAIARGDQRRFGIPRPDHPLGHEHPTLSQDLPKLAREGRVDVRPDVARIDGRTVRFVDGTEAEIDVIIAATGYHVSFPWLAPDLLERVDPPDPRHPIGTEDRAAGRIPGNRIRLYRHVVPPEVEGLYFLGLVQPLGPIPPLAEAQAEWVAELVGGTGRLPDRDEMWRSIERTTAELERRFVASSRHTLEVDFFPYRRLLARERARSRERASVIPR